jgi:hypothetical protein
MSKYPTLIGKLLFGRILILSLSTKKLVCNFHHAEFSLGGACNNIRK